jgi:hypothetical protein
MMQHRDAEPNDLDRYISIFGGPSDRIEPVFNRML